MPRWLRYTLRLVGGIVALILVLLVGLYAISTRRIHAIYAVNPEPIAITSDLATIARGQHLTVAIGKCVDCHGDKLAGQTVIDNPAFGHIYASNLTRGQGGVGAAYTDADFVRAIRHGVKRDSASVLFMPVADFYHFNDADLAAIIAYIRSIPPADHQLPSSSLGPIGRVLLVSDKVPVLIPAHRIAHTAPRPALVTPGPTLEYGSYLARVGGCFSCHGETLAGGPVPGGPPEWPLAANLTPAAIGTWSEANFTHALRSGQRPDGSVISAVMPWRYTRLMTDDEIHALWLYVRTVPAVTRPKT